MARDESREPRRVRQMFGRVARRYDLLNHLLSANLDRRWRRSAARRLRGSSARHVLDLCGGTGDLSLELVRQAGADSVVCCDFSHPMLQLARRKFLRSRVADRCLVVEGDGLRLPFASDAFDAVTVAFGVRNLEDMEVGFQEMLRVLRPGGSLLVLEFSRPEGWLLSRLYGLYLRGVLPRLGERISGDTAYGYLARTIRTFPAPDALADRIRRSGFARCRWERLTGGIVAVHAARKPGAQSPPTIT